MQRLIKLQECNYCHYEVRRPCSTPDEGKHCANAINALLQANKRTRDVLDDTPVTQQRASMDD